LLLKDNPVLNDYKQKVARLSLYAQNPRNNWIFSPFDCILEA